MIKEAPIKPCAGLLFAIFLFLAPCLSAQEDLLGKTQGKTELPQAKLSTAEQVFNEFLEITQIEFDVIDFGGRKYVSTPDTDFFDLDGGVIELADFSSGETVDITYNEETSAILVLRKTRKPSRQHLLRLEEIENSPELAEPKEEPKKEKMGGGNVRFINGKYVN